MSRNDYTTGNTLDFSYHQNYYKVIGINLTRWTNTSIPEQINFTGKLEDVSVNNVFYSWKAAKAILNFSLDSFIVTE